MRSFIPAHSRCRPVLYDLMLDYPLREAKALRPALCIATCRALGGTLEGVLKSAAVIEFYHNAFLIHDDIEDASEKRRDGLTLHRVHGVPIAINVGDAMLALALEPLLDNMRLLGLGKALQILQAIARMARESAEGQALELSWVSRAEWTLADREYLRMVHQKTGFYTFITPMQIGGIVARADALVLGRLNRFATALGMAFQIQDDILNLTADENRYGKEILGDLWEGKHTLILLHAMRSASARERQRAQQILKKARPKLDGSSQTLLELVNDLAERREISEQVRKRLAAACASDAIGACKTPADVEYLYRLIQRYRSVDYARSVGMRRAQRAQRYLHSLSSHLRPSVHVDFLYALTNFVVERNH